MSLSTYYFEYDRHVARLRRHCRAYTPASNTASYENDEKINSWVSFSFLYEYGAPLGGPTSAKTCRQAWVTNSFLSLNFFILQISQHTPEYMEKGFMGLFKS